MKAKIKYLKFQRNGVAGEPFYHCLIDLIEKDLGGVITREMIVTFRATNDDKGIIPASCRVVCLAEISEAWRGDEIAYSLQRTFDAEMKEKGGTIYDCCTKTEIYSV